MLRLVTGSRSSKARTQRRSARTRSPALRAVSRQHRDATSAPPSASARTSATMRAQRTDGAAPGRRDGDRGQNDSAMGSGLVRQERDEKPGVRLRHGEGGGVRPHQAGVCVPLRLRKEARAERRGTISCPRARQDRDSRPVPQFIEPCLAALASEVPEGDRWLHEIKWDGYRLHLRVENGRVRLLTRRGLDWTHRFPPIAAAAAKLPVRTAYLDGEAIVEHRGIADFGALQQELAAGAAHNALLFAFDLLYLDGQESPSRAAEFSARACCRNARRTASQLRDPLLRALVERWPGDAPAGARHGAGGHCLQAP